MKTIITEEMRFRERVVKYAIKHKNNAEAARRYHTSRQQVQRWRRKYDGRTISLANKSTRSYTHANQYTEEELKQIKQMYRRYGFEGLAQVYRKLINFRMTWRTCPSSILSSFKSSSLTLLRYCSSTPSISFLNSPFCLSPTSP